MPRAGCLRVRRSERWWALAFAALVSCGASAQVSPTGSPGSGPRIVGLDERQGWGIAVEGRGLAGASARAPVHLEYWDGTGAHAAAFAYARIRRSSDGLHGSARVTAPGGGAILVEDDWTVSSGIVHFHRTLRVAGNGSGGFLSGIALAPDRASTRADVQLFAPGIIYGRTAHLGDASIGGAATYRTGTGATWIREDRMPAPLFGMRMADGSSIAVLDPAPNGATTPADAHDVAAVPMVDAGLRFGAIGGRVADGRAEIGFRYPGSEGEVTYLGNTYPGGQVARWRRRYHPLADGLVQDYRVDFRFGRDESFPDFYAAAWRWAWATLKPAVHRQDIDLARRSIADMLADRIDTVGGRSGVPQFMLATPPPPGSDPRTEPGVDRRAVMGFTGKNLEVADLLLAEAARDPGTRGQRMRARAGAVIDSFTRLGMTPPVGDGFDLDTGVPTGFRNSDLGSDVVFLRSLADDMKALLRAVRRERAHGHEHPAWLAWARGFGDWLLTQQRADGGFPRAWRMGTGVVASASEQSSYNPVPFLVLLGELTRDPRYLAAGARAGDFAWSAGQADGVFVGGTIDNPDVIDKEAGTLSLEAYLALYGATRDAKWLARARMAAAFAETWIYLWDVPMPPGGAEAGWKPGVPTTGVQLIATGHSLVDEYMSFDVGSFARLGQLTGDAHESDVARLLLHDTKAMLALPGRVYDLRGPGWQQEHWSMAPRRGDGLHRGWLPWVATSQLRGIDALMDDDPALFVKLASGR